MKICIGCGKGKPDGEFPKVRANVDGRSGRCKRCTKARRHQVAN